MKAINVKESKIIIIGCGPSGIAAAIQLKRQGIDSILVVEKSIPGGLLRNANLVENYPGFPDGISGKNLSVLFMKQFEKYGIPFEKDEITDIELSEKKQRYVLKAISGNYYSCDFLIIATGTEPLKPNLKIPESLKNRIFYEIADLSDTNNKKICIIGGGDAAFDYALNLSSKVTELKIKIRSDKDKTFDLLRNRVKRDNRISVEYRAVVESVENHDGKPEITTNYGDFKKTEIFDYLIFAIGRKALKPVSYTHLTLPTN